VRLTTTAEAGAEAGAEAAAEAGAEAAAEAAAEAGAAGGGEAGGEAGVAGVVTSVLTGEEDGGTPFALALLSPRAASVGKRVVAGGALHTKTQPRTQDAQAQTVEKGERQQRQSEASAGSQEGECEDGL